MSRLDEVVKEFWEIVDSVECSDNGKYFFPTRMEFSSCRTLAGMKLGKLIEEMRTITSVKPRMSEKEMHLLNHPDDCPECLGVAIGCKVCKGSGSSDPTVPMLCPRCEGTGDTQNHERESNDCPVCKCKGRVQRCPKCDEGVTIDWNECMVCDGSGLIPLEDW